MFGLVLGWLRGLFRSRAELVIENLALRQQLAVLKRKRRRPGLKRVDRLFWVALRGMFARWSQVLVIVEPETVVRWHRAEFKVLWRWKSRPRGRPSSTREIRELIRRMAQENETWGAPRIHAELLKLGFHVSERTVSRYLPKGEASPDAIERWKRFLRNHREVIAAMDFFTVPTASFQLLFVFFVIHHSRREILHINVTSHPCADWIVQQLREAFPYDEAPRFLIFDRDAKFSQNVIAILEGMGIEPCRTAFRSPWQNGTAERWIGSVRRELLDHVVIFMERQLLRLLREYVGYYHEDRPHLGLGKETPLERVVMSKPSGRAQVVCFPRLGGLHHRYEWREAA